MILRYRGRHARPSIVQRLAQGYTMDWDGAEAKILASRPPVHTVFFWLVVVVVVQVVAVRIRLY